MQKFVKMFNIADDRRHVFGVDLIYSCNDHLLAMRLKYRWEWKLQEVFKSDSEAQQKRSTQSVS